MYEGDTRAIRVWLRQNGIQISDRGRVPTDLMAMYERAHGIERIPDDQDRKLPLIPLRGCSTVLRTDFSDEEAWRRVVAAIETPTREGFIATADYCQDRAFADLTTAQLLEHLPNGHDDSVLFVVDALTIQDPEHPLIAIGISVHEPPVRELRLIPSAVQAVGDNLRISNMWFQDFVVQADPDGILRLY